MPIHIRHVSDYPLKPCIKMMLHRSHKCILRRRESTTVRPGPSAARFRAGEPISFDCCHVARCTRLVLLACAVVRGKWGCRSSRISCPTDQRDKYFPLVRANHRSFPDKAGARTRSNHVTLLPSALRDCHESSRTRAFAAWLTFGHFHTGHNGCGHRHE